MFDYIRFVHIEYRLKCTVLVYESCYQSKLAGKAKGSGLGLYINSMFAFDELQESSVCSPDLETIFIKITNTLEPVIIGAVYRPPSGNPVHFNQQFHSILELLPKSNVYIAGDFNLNLSSVSQDTNTSNFQESFLSAGFYPTISLPTHEIPNCNATCIDNIFTNNPGSVIFSATIKESVSHHHPILCLCTSDQFSSTVGKELPPKTFWRYNFNQTNVAALLLETADMTNDLVLCSNFDGLLARFSDIIDKTCKEEISCNSKRNSIDNPWITPVIINSVNTKHDLYRSWQKTIKNKKDPEDHGDQLMSVQRRRERYIILHMWKIFTHIAPNDIGVVINWNDRTGPVCRVLQLRSKSMYANTLRYHSFASIGPRLFNALPRFIKESSTLDSFKGVLDDFLMTLPDTPPTPGYIAANNNSLLDWIVTNSRALPEVLS